LSSLFTKLDLRQALGEGAIRRTLDQLQLQGKDLVAKVSKINPVQGSKQNNAIVEVEFQTDKSFTLPKIQVPVYGFEWHRYPIKVGDQGAVKAGSVDNGQVSGLGASGPSGFVTPGNLAPLFFQAMGNVNWSSMDDLTAHLIYGDTGTVNRDTNKKSKHIVHPTAGVTTQTGAQGSTGPESSPSYNINHFLHPENGLLANIKDATNGDHNLSIVPQGGSGVIGWLASLFGGKHKHQIDSSGHNLSAENGNHTHKITSAGHQLDTTASTAINSAQTTSVNGTNGVSLNGGSNGVSVQSIMKALSGMSFGSGGSGGSVSSSGAMSLPGPIASTAGDISATGNLNATQAVTCAKINTTPVLFSALAGLSPVNGDRAFITDSPSVVFNAAVTSGGGAHGVPVFYDGSASQWRIG
jgi:hypothetical protein